MNEEIAFSIRLSLQVSLISSFLVGIVGTAIAYVFATRDFRGKFALQMLCHLPLVLPPTVIGYYLVLLFGRQGFLGASLYALSGWSLMFSWWAAVLAAFVVSLPLMIKAAELAIASVDPKMKQTAYVLGYTERETFFRIILPLAKRGLLTGLILSMTRGLGEFGATLMLAGNIPGQTNTMPLTIYSLATSGDWQKAHIVALLLTLISTFFLWLTIFLQKETPSYDR